MDGVRRSQTIDLRAVKPIPVPTTAAVDLPTPPAEATTSLPIVRPLSGVRIDGLGNLSPRPLAQQPPAAISSAGPSLSLPSLAALPSLPSLPSLTSLPLPNVTPQLAAMITGAILVPLLGIAGWKVSSHPVVNPAGSRSHAAASTSLPVASAQTTQKTTAPQTYPELQKLVSDFSASTGAPFGVVVKDLKTGAVATSNPDQVFVSASLYKLFVAEAIFKRIDNGALKLGDSADSGTGLDISDCLNYMITISDNACGRALGVKVGWGDENANLANLGFTHTTLADPQQTSASDVALLLERLYQGTLLSPNSSQLFLNLLKNQRVNNRLPAGLPDGTTIAHKTGDLDGYVHDAGIIFSPKTDYLVVGVSGPWPNSADAPPKFADLASKSYSFFNP